jgi:hypothetical protein
MNAYEIAHKLTLTEYPDNAVIFDAAHMLCKQSDTITKYKQVLESIANERIELSHDKIKWQCEDHIRWAKDALK